MRLLNVFYPGSGIDAARSMFPPHLIKELQELVEYREIPKPASSQDPGFLSELYQADILLTGWGTPALPADLKQRGKVQYVCHVTGAVRGVIPRILMEQGLLVTNWGTAISRTIAEASLMMILACLRRVRPIQEALHNRGGYRGVPRAHSLFGRRVGLIGFGAIARDLVALLQPFGVRITAYDPYVSDEVFSMLGVERAVEPQTIFSACDVISLHAGKTRETHHMVSKEMLRLLADDAVLVNTSRGSLVDEQALAEEMQAGRLWVALDVYEQEPLPQDSPLRGQERVLLFPHQAGPTVDRYVDMGQMAVANIRTFVQGEPLQAVVTLAQYDIMT